MHIEMCYGQLSIISSLPAYKLHHNSRKSVHLQEIVKQRIGPIRQPSAVPPLKLIALTFETCRSVYGPFCLCPFALKTRSHLLNLAGSQLVRFLGQLHYRSVMQWTISGLVRFMVLTVSTGENCFPVFTASGEVVNMRWSSRYFLPFTVRQGPFFPTNF
jgi:hypothetical protein